MVERLARRAAATIGAPVERQPISLEKPLTAEQRAEREKSKAKLLEVERGLLVAIEGPAQEIQARNAGVGNLGSLFLNAPSSVQVRYDGRDEDCRERAADERRQRVKELQQQRRERADRKWLDKFIDKQLASGVPLDAIPPNCQRTTYLMAQEILRDSRASNGRAQKWIQRFADRFPWLCPALAMIRDAALQPLDGGGFLQDFSEAQPRRIVAEALTMIAEAEKTKKKGRFTLILRGFSVGALAGIVHTPGNTARKPHRNRVGGAGRKPELARTNAAARRWRDRDVRTTPERKTSRTDLQRLRDSGFLYAQQLPASAVAVWERDTEQHVRNRYWLATEGLHGSDAAALHELGAMWGREVIETPLRVPP